jgi:NAD(P)-dependent dehydrogenase (short-subunit alcohol dehydrogenase family)
LNIRKTIREYTEKDLDRVVTLNLKGTFYFFQAFARLMIEQGAGSIIACSSFRAVTIEPSLAVCGSTKAAIGLVKGFGSEVGRFGVRVNAIAPSIVETALTEPSSVLTSTSSTPRTPCSIDGVTPTKSHARWPSWPPMRRAT